MRTDGSVACWGWDEDGQATPPAGEFSSVSAGEFHTCGVRIDGSVACWGRDVEGQASPPDGEFTSVSAGGQHTCGLRTDGSVACWGDDSYGNTAPSEGGVHLGQRRRIPHLRVEGRRLYRLLGI